MRLLRLRLLLLGGWELEAGLLLELGRHSRRLLVLLQRKAGDGGEQTHGGVLVLSLHHLLLGLQHLNLLLESQLFHCIP